MQAAVAAVRALDNQGLYSRGSVRPDRFPSSSYSDWNEWKRHFAWIAQANGWTEEQARSALPTCLTSWALDEFSAMPRHYRDRVQGRPPPTLQRMFGYLDPRMQPYRTQRTARSEFKSTFQAPDEGIREFSRRIRSIGEIANANMNRAVCDDMNREQFIDGLLDTEVQELLLREDPPTFEEAVNRALNLDALSRLARDRQRRRIGIAGATFDSHGDKPRNTSRATNSMMAASTSEPVVLDEFDRRFDQFTKKLDVVESNFTSMVKQFMERVTEGLQSGSLIIAPKMADGKNEPRSGAQRRAEIVSSGNCFRCGQPGHFARNCPGTQDHLN